MACNKLVRFIELYKYVARWHPGSQDTIAIFSVAAIRQSVTPFHFETVTLTNYSLVASWANFVNLPSVQGMVPISYNLKITYYSAGVSFGVSNPYNVQGDWCARFYASGPTTINGKLIVMYVPEP